MPPKRKLQQLGVYTKNKGVINGMEQKILIQQAELEALQNDSEELATRVAAAQKKKIELQEQLQKEEADLAAEEKKSAATQAKNVKMKDVLKKKVDKSEKSLKRKKERLAKIAGDPLQKVDTKNLWTVSRVKGSKRKSKPTSCEGGDVNLVKSAKYTRRSETFEAACHIHGGNTSNFTPVLDGLLDTALVKFNHDQVAKRLLLKKKFKTKLEKIVVKEWVKQYEKSEENMLRSINMYLTHGICGKLRYQQWRNTGNRFAGPNFVPYRKLALAIKAIDIHRESLRPISPSLTEGLDEDEIFPGMYRSCDQYIPHLASVYF